MLVLLGTQLQVTSMTSQDLDYITVKTEIRYGFDCSSQNYSAELCISIPSIENGRLIELARNNDSKLFHDTLHSSWGSEEDGFRVGYYTLIDKDLDTLRSLAVEMLKDQIESLQSVVRGNRESISALPYTSSREDRIL